MPKNDNQIVGIKAIADYLDMSVRNIYYWEKKLGLPLHRIGEIGSRRVFAYKDELDIWLRNKDIRVLKRKKLKWLFIAVSIVAVFIVLFIFVLKIRSNNRSMNSPELISVDKDIVQVRNSKGEVLWTFRGHHGLNDLVLGKYVDLEDVDGDGLKEIIACTHELETNRFLVSFFDHNGTVLWRKSVVPKYTFNNEAYENFYRSGFVKFTKANQNIIHVISKWTHMARFPTIFACHDLNGNLLNQYLHVGIISDTVVFFDLNDDEIEEIIFSGTNNLLNGEGILGVLPVEGFRGISPPYRIEPEYIEQNEQLKIYIADKMERGNQFMYLRFKKPDFLQKYSVFYNNVKIRYISRNQIHVALTSWFFEPEKIPLGVDYIFNNKFQLIQVLPQPELKSNYSELLRNKDIDIPLEELLEFFKSNVYLWQNDLWIPVEKIDFP
ncbi:MAG: hypothetical protein JXB26_18465 [Candidatus Aminicenantes bacterium]|nr:hypothetical protein [Candidatus Aminicenantes bacterium]